MSVFTIERLLELFWLAVQQCCFVGLKYAYDGAVRGAGRGVRLSAIQCMVFLAFAVFAFQPELGLNFMSGLYNVRGIDYFAWIVRMTLCAAMVLFDGFGVPASSATLCGDLLLAAAVLLPSCVYIWGSISASEKFMFDRLQYMWVGRFFVELANCAYIALEGTAALMFWKFIGELKRSGAGRDA